MITSHRSSGLLLTASFLMIGPFFWSADAAAANRTDRDSPPVGEPVTIYSSGSSNTSKTTIGQSQSMVARAATGQWTDDELGSELPPLAKEGVETVGFWNQTGTGCGPVCDCGACDAACGVDAIYETDPGCGIETGCGIGQAYIDGPGCGIETMGDCSCDACSSCAPNHIPLCVPILRMNWCSFDFFWGHQGYTGPLNYVSLSESNPDSRSGNGSFGFYQGFNKGSSLKRWLGCDIASQLGVRATQSNLSGAGFTRERRYQVFLTTGLFRRVDYGLQYGMVLDYLNQDWYFQSDALQLRGELSWRCEGCETYGFQFMSGVRNETSGTVVRSDTGETLISTIRMEPTDQFRLFYRRPLPRSGQFTAFAGWTDRDDGILGSQFNLHLFPRILLATDLTYLIPKEGRSSGGNEEESWNLSIGLVFRPGGSRASRSYNLPMFDVADNGTFLMDRR